METTATTSTIWGFAFNALCKIIQSYLCSVWFYQNGAIYIIVQKPAPNAECSVQEIVDTLYEICRLAGMPALYIWAIEERFLKEYMAVKGYDIASEYSDDWSEYTYRKDDLLELSGGVNLNKRTRLKKFINATNISLQPLTVENIKICLDIEEEWCSHQDCEQCGAFAGCAKTSLEIMIDIFDRSIYDGVLAYIDDAPVAYAIWEKTNKKIAFIYFAKSNVSDFNVYLYYTMVKMHFSDVEYINVGHDMGKQGLRTFKKHLSAYKLLCKYLCTFTKAGGSIS
jgi:hypothetical protein